MIDDTTSVPIPELEPPAQELEPPAQELEPPAQELEPPAQEVAPPVETVIVGDANMVEDSAMMVVPPDVVEGGIELLLPILEEISGGLTELQEEPRPFLTTPIEEYSVTEGSLLVIVVLLFLGFLYNVIKEAF